MTTATAAPRPLVPALQPLYASLSNLSYPLVRFTAGIMLMPHGAQKLFGWFGGNIEDTAGFFAQIVLEPALALNYVVGASKFFGKAKPRASPSPIAMSE